MAGKKNVSTVLAAWETASSRSDSHFDPTTRRRWRREFEGGAWKAMISFSDIQDAFLFVSSSPYGEHSALLCKDTGEILYRSEMGGIDEIGDEDRDWDKWIGIPHRNDLDLGQRLVFEFVEMRMPNEYGRVEQIFRKRGAYGRFKDFLESKGQLEGWHDFENQREEQALRQWCEENEIELSD